ncbi:MAG: DNA polymerase I [Cyanobacteria bacterium]|nr:DNA polymerase I [Cyanobacteriota bacterium]
MTVLEREKTLILIDGHSLAYRSYFALERTGLKTRAGEPTWAIHGFFSALMSLFKTVKPDAIAVAFDMGRETFRNEMYPEYKAHREAMPDALKAQMGAIRAGVEAFGIPIFENETYEADDLIGSLSTRAAREGFMVQILTGDQDAFQLVEDGEIELLIPSRDPKQGLTRYNRAQVFAKWGIYPEQVPDFKGLKGDTSDNIPGVPGIGDKTAAKLLEEDKTLEGVYANLAKRPANKLKEKLETFQDQAFLSKKLATIIRDVPMTVDWQQCHLSGTLLEPVEAFFTRWECRNLLKSVPEVLSPWVTTQTITKTQEETIQPLPEVSPVEQVLVQTQAQLDHLLHLLSERSVFAIDLETTGLDYFQNHIVGVAIAVARNPEQFQAAFSVEAEKEEDANRPQILQATHASTWRLAVNETAEKRGFLAFYIPLRHQTQETQLSSDLVFKALVPFLSDPGRIKVIHNEKFEKNMLLSAGYPVLEPVFDTMLASYVLNPDRRHGLKQLAFELLHVEMIEIESLIGTGKKQTTFDYVPLTEAARYASTDAWVTLALAEHLLKAIPQERLSLLYDVELPLAGVLVAMERDGVAIDTAYLQQLNQQIDQQLAVLQSRIHQTAGSSFNINSPTQVGELLFEKMGLTPLKKTASKSAYSTDAKVLTQLASEHPIVQEILDYRQLFKLKSTYIESLPELINPVTHRIHTNFNQTSTATGRLSSSNPNLQNIPIRTELGRQIRAAFLPGKHEEPKEDWALMSADYSQIELRLLAHFSEDAPLIQAFHDGIDVHALTASLVFGVPVEAVTKEQRYRAKTVNFGVVYGQTAHGLSQQLKIPRAEAQWFINSYFDRYKGVQRFIETVKQESHQTGEVKTLAGRVRDLKEGLNSSVKSIREFSERAAFNTPLQGSASDLMKIAMIRLFQRMNDEKLKSQLILQVHDEIVIELYKPEQTAVTEAVLWAMELDQPLKVPLVVDVFVGPTWMES